MLTLLGLVIGFMGLFGFIACIGGLIYALVTKKGKVGWIIGLVLCAVLVPVGLIVLGISLPNETPPTQKTDQKKEDTKQDNKEGEGEDQNPQEDGTGADEDDNKQEPPQEDKSDEQVIYDENGISVTFLGFKQGDDIFGGFYIRLRIENNSEFNYTVQVRDLSVNGIMADSVFSCDVVAGKKATDSIWIINMEESGISIPITDAEFRFHIFDAGDWSNSFDTDLISIPQE